MINFAKTTNTTLIAMALAVLGIYLFAGAPPPLPDQERSQSSTVSIKAAMDILNAENNVVRLIYTKEIVAAGKKAGLMFDEQWEDENTSAGPLPAQFLRLTALNIEKSRIRLGLYLGSDYPVNKANAFAGQQLQLFQQIKLDQKPRFFFVSDVKVYAYMFPDVAISDACVQCHNAHANSPKKDWKLHDVMGATTWIYEKDSISLEQLINMLAVLRQSVRGAYETYLVKLAKLKTPPTIGDKWPRQGYYLPSADHFMDAIVKQSAPGTLSSISRLMNSRHGSSGDKS